MKYLIDTDWIIYHLNGVEAITKKLKKYTASGICTSIISVAELYEGIYGSKDYDESLDTLETFLEGITVLLMDHEICKIFGRERNKLRKQGNIIGDFDLLIASICLRYDLILLTNNKKHFEKIDFLKIMS